MIWVSWVEKMNRRTVVFWQIGTAATTERSIIAFRERDWEARGKSCDARDGPTTQQLARHTVA